MIAILELEVFQGNPARGLVLQGTAPWVALITGLNSKGYFVRQFERGDTDYSRANSVGSRGVFRYYHLKSGRIYEVAERFNWRRQEQYFCRVNHEGDIVRLTRQQVLDVFQDARHAPVQAVSRGISDE